MELLVARQLDRRARGLLKLPRDPTAVPLFPFSCTTASAPPWLTKYDYRAPVCQDGLRNKQPRVLQLNSGWEPATGPGTPIMWAVH
jgi:hypothetical protein